MGAESQNRMCDLPVRVTASPLEAHAKYYTQLIYGNRIRHIRCDEATPVCLQCFRAGKRCVSYVLRPPDRQLTTTAVTPTATELSLNQYFRTHVIGSLADEFDHEFFVYMLPQSAHSMVPIWHASNALAASLWVYSTSEPVGRSAPRLARESIVQESATIKCILALTQGGILTAEQKTMVLLANFLLFQHFQPHKNYDACFAIQAKTLQLIHHWRYWECLDSVPVSALATQILHIWVKSARVLQESQLVMMYRPEDNWQAAVTWLQTRPLSSPIRAYIEIEMIWASLRSVLETLPLRPSKEEIEVAQSRRMALLHTFAKWEARFDTLTIRGLQSTALHARRILTAVLLSVDLSRLEGLWDETCWDDFVGDFAAALTLISTAENGPANWYLGEMKYSPLIWNCLCFIARYCRDSKVRGDAVATLRASMVAALDGLPSGFGEETKKKQASNILIAEVVAMEENAWSTCTETPPCRQGTYVCNMHRVVAVHSNPLGVRPTVFTCFTAGDILHGVSGRKFFLSVTSWA